MDRRRAYEIEVLSTFARLGRAPEISDADRDNERLAQRSFFAALAHFKQQVRAALALSGLRKEALGDLLIRLDDATPDAEAWDDAIAASRRGY